MMTAPPYPPYSPAPRHPQVGAPSGTYPIPPYAVRYAAPITPIPPAPAHAPLPAAPQLAMHAAPVHAPQAPAYRPMPKASPRVRREVGLIVCGAMLVFSAMLCAIACAVHLHAFAGAAARFAANASLTDEARALGLEAAQRASLWRAVVFGPGALAFGIGGIIAIVRGARASRH